MYGFGRYRANTFYVERTIRPNGPVWTNQSADDRHHRVKDDFFTHRQNPLDIVWKRDILHRTSFFNIWEGKMAFCFCRFLLAALVIVFAWLNVEWGKIALTVIGALLVILALKRDFCCMAKKGEK
jgi:hypothetical protein